MAAPPAIDSTGADTSPRETAAATAPPAETPKPAPNAALHISIVASILSSG